MRILRVRVAHYKGIEAADLAFAPCGLTIVEGRNEAGKTSIAQAIDLVFDYPDSSKHEVVRSTKPVDRDVATEIEVEVDTGPYAFTLWKRFHKQPATELRISRPKPEELTGRPAHERAAAMLEETLDLHLWRALRIVQGQKLEAPALSAGKQLSACLDRAAGGAAGGAVAGGAAESLYDAIRAEYHRYFTEKTGQERKELVDAQGAYDGACAAVLDLDQRLAAIEDDIARCAALELMIKEHGERAVELAATRAKREEEHARLEELERTRRHLAAAAQGADAEWRTAEHLLAERRRLVEAVDSTRLAHDRHLAGVEELAPAIDAASREATAAGRAVQTARAARTEAVAALALARADLEFRREEVELADLVARHRRAAVASSSIRSARATLERARTTPAALGEVERLHAEVERARARLEVACPTLRIEALADLSARIGDEELALARGAHADRVVAGETTIELPGVARFSIRPGSSAATLADDLARRTGDLARRCAELGVADPDAARECERERAEAERAVGAYAKALSEVLGTLREDELEARVALLRGRVEAYPREREDCAPLPADRAGAQAVLRAAEDVESETRAAEEAAERAARAARERADATSVSARVATARLEDLERALSIAIAALERARIESSDDALTGSARTLRERAVAAQAAAERAARLLAQEDLDLAAERRRNARAACEQVERERVAAIDERLRLRGRLEAHGEEGLGEQRFEAETRRIRTEGELARLRARARAARTLYDAMDAEREAARAAYRAPLKERIERLGRWYGGGFAVDLDEDLRITSRTLDGRTIPFAELSGGAREQLALIARLATAMIVAEDGGVPLILDDALGYTDPARLEQMGAVLSLAAKSCQVIVLTCVPERYRHVGDALRVRLG